MAGPHVRAWVVSNVGFRNRRTRRTVRKCGLGLSTVTARCVDRGEGRLSDLCAVGLDYGFNSSRNRIHPDKPLDYNMPARGGRPGRGDWERGRDGKSAAVCCRQDDPTPIGKGVDSVSRGVIPRFWPRFRCPAPSPRRPEGRITRDGRGRRNASPSGGAGMCFRWKKGGGGAVWRVPVAGGGPPGSRPCDWAAGGAWLR